MHARHLLRHIGRSSELSGASASRYVEMLLSPLFILHQVTEAHIYLVAYVLRAEQGSSCSKSSNVSINTFLSGRGKGLLVAGRVMLVSACWQDSEEHGGELGEGDYAVPQRLCRQPGHSLLPLAPLSFLPAL